MNPEKREPEGNLNLGKNKESGRWSVIGAQWSVASDRNSRSSCEFRLF